MKSLLSKLKLTIECLINLRSDTLQCDYYQKLQSRTAIKKERLFKTRKQIERYITNNSSRK